MYLQRAVSGLVLCNVNSDVCADYCIKVMTGFAVQCHLSMLVWQ